MNRLIATTALFLSAFSAANAGTCIAPGALLPPPEMPQSIRSIYALAASSDMIVAGAAYDGVNAMNSGAAAIYRRTTGGWDLETILRIDSTNTNLLFGAGVAIDGDAVIIGVPGVFNHLGAAICYRKIEGEWTAVSGIQRANAASNTGYGYTLDADGGVAMIGAPYGGAAGVVHVFNRSGDSWTEQDTLTNPSTEHYYFGSSITLRGDYAAITASYGNDGSAVFVYRREAGGWVLDATIPSPIADYREQFGISHSISGERLAVGSINSDSGEGRVYIYERAGGAWTPMGTADDPSPGDYESFARSVALDGDRLFVGCPGELTGGQCPYQIGAAYLYEKRPSGWSLAGRLDHPGGACSSGFGGNIAIAGKDVIIGSPYDFPVPNQEGSMAAFPIDQPNFHQHPQNESIAPGATALFSAAVESAPGAMIRWRRNGAPLTDDARIHGATTTSLTILNTTASDAGAYDCTITNYCGDLIASYPAALLISAPPSSTCPGDADGSGMVNFADITSVLTNFNMMCP